MTINCITKNALDRSGPGKIVLREQGMANGDLSPATQEEQAGTTQLHQRNISGGPATAANEASIDSFGRG